jgi:hypothetical protein
MELYYHKKKQTMSDKIALDLVLKQMENND